MKIEETVADYPELVLMTILNFKEADDLIDKQNRMVLGDSC